MDASVIAAVVAVVLTAIGVCGIIVPVLPGSLTVGAGLLVWAIWGSSPWGWWAFGVGLVLLAIGMSASLVLTKRHLDDRKIPQWPVFVGLVCGVVAGFLLPALGLVIGFVAGLLVSEYIRVKDFKEAVSTSWAATKAIGLGMLIELGCAMAASGLLATSMLTAWL